MKALRSSIIWYVLLGLLSVVQIANSADKRVALVIGNSNYESSPLKNPVNDARDMSAALRKLGFDVIELTDASRRGMFNAMREFRQKLRGTQALGLFYFAGHGAQYEGRNYLLPVDHQVRDASELQVDSVSAQDILVQMKAAGNPINVVILDACRNQPFPGSTRDGARGLARMDSISGSLIAYATAPGSIAEDGNGRNGVYTSALLQQLSKPNQSLSDMFNQVGLEVSRATAGKQEPWISSSPLTPIYLAGKTISQITTTETNVTATDKLNVTDVNFDKEMVYWNEVSNSTDSELIQTYIDQYPNGTFVGLAKIKLKRLTETNKQPTQVSGVINIERLLQECQTHFQANRLTTGLGGNAANCYTEVLQQSPGNSTALKGLFAIEEKYQKWAESALKKGHVAKAEQYLKKLKSLNTESPVVRNLEEILISSVETTAFKPASVLANGAGRRLSSSVPDWTGGAVTCKVAQLILENELGYKVKAITMPSGAGVYEAVASGDLDYACESWPSYSSSKDIMIEKFGGDGSVAYLGPVGVVGVSTYYVPRYFVDEVAPDLKSYKDLNKYKEHFATIETNGKGRLIACPTPAWECDDQKRLDLLGVDFVASELGTETAAWAEAQAAYKRKEAFLLYAWEPHWIHAKLDLVSVELPAHNADTWPATGWRKDITFNYGNPESMAMDGVNADAAHLLSNMNLSNAEQSKMVLEIDVEGHDIEEVVSEWLAANEDTWRAWLK